MLVQNVIKMLMQNVIIFQLKIRVHQNLCPIVRDR